MHRCFPRRLWRWLPLLLVVLAQPAITPEAHAFILAKNLPAPETFDSRWTSTATNSTTVGYGSPITLTWSLVPEGTSVSQNNQTGYGTTIGKTNNLISTFDATYGAGPGGTDYTQRPWFHLFSDSFARWNQLGGINFVYEPHDSANQSLGSTALGAKGVRGDIRIGGANIDNADNTLAETLFPQNGDILIDTSDASFFSDSSNNFRAFRDTLMHETGHAFGLEHIISNTNEFLMAPVIDMNIDGPQLDEVRAIQYFYGDPNEKSHNGQGNNTAALATSLGSIAFGGSFDVGSSAVGKTSGANMVVNPTESDFVSIFSTTDADYYSFTVSAATKLTAVLTPRGGTFTQTDQEDPNPPTAFNANNRNNLVLTLFDTNGTSQLATINSAAAGLAETLSGISLPAAGQYYLRVTGTTADSVQLYDLNLSIAGLTGDYNHDGIVDAADYTVWRDELGKTGSGLAADSNNDNLVDNADYTAWLSNYGKTNSGSGSFATTGVPEPSTAALAILPMALFLLRRARQVSPTK
jgi:serralysin